MSSSQIKVRIELTEASAMGSLCDSRPNSDEMLIVLPVLSRPTTVPELKTVVFWFRVTPRNLLHSLPLQPEQVRRNHIEPLLLVVFSCPRCSAESWVCFDSVQTLKLGAADGSGCC